MGPHRTVFVVLGDHTQWDIALALRKLWPAVSLEPRRPLPCLGPLLGGCGQAIRERDAPDDGQCCRSNAAVVVSDAVAASAHGALCAASAAPQAEFCVMFQGAKERET